MADLSDGDEAFARAEQSIGLFQITEALLGHHFPATRDALSREVGHEEVILEEGVVATMADVLRQLPDVTYDTAQDVVIRAQSHWRAIRGTGRPAAP